MRKAIRAWQDTELFLQVEEIGQAKAGRGVDLDQKVDVALGPGLVARRRPERAELRDAACLWLWRRLAQDAQHAITLGEGRVKGSVSAAMARMVPRGAILSSNAQTIRYEVKQPWSQRRK